ncbi:hypothetical protein FVEG_17003 [Fusarium verticillioides 7600]|uniref:Uncharacterized protein n=1 Tax=Gibberella moniliformis (strain M3125 / FGSC 7600) TaxID=334819 RepID=W7MMD8_GIBM7|nr:hypothetical protein FVEG_17003 [Fusarium verticillioides 7600]XP_018758840.1 hypothetical protein FVEG_17003 [Fusarium verticillioides 7600]XP_018758841.1 hypothetical protein FVEG_17003 [Fusarium verticillioides 7600]EWG52648.1 hypothetical protein FVEG_17003 [Fusarium verticillioides 7600]EWG52649.1 hypothetical protein FVEG_17003 [Fusarium verticillioides 7600]EWG52650.1 hypothetical protein FVEG_17003 [Fusarium verticillioides 7600]
MLNEGSALSVQVSVVRVGDVSNLDSDVGLLGRRSIELVGDFAQLGALFIILEKHGDFVNWLRQSVIVSEGHLRLKSLDNIRIGHRHRRVDSVGCRIIPRMSSKPCGNRKKTVVIGHGSARIRDGSRWGMGRARLRWGESSKRLSIEIQVLIKGISNVNNHGIEVSRNLKAEIVNVGKVLSRLHGAISRWIESLGSVVVAREVSRGLFVGGLRSEAVLL